MSLKIYIGGRLVDKQDATISVYDHGFLYGDGVFEGMRSYGGRVFRLDAHLERLWESAAAICLTIPLSHQEMAAAVDDTLKANNITDGYVRLVVTRGSGTLGLDPNRCTNPQVVIIADHISLYPEKFYQEGLEIITASTIRNHPAALSPRIKSLNYLNNIMAKIEGTQATVDEVLEQEAAECTGDNIFIVRQGRLVTPPLDAGILAGITRQAVIDLAREAGLHVEELAMTRHDVFIADECFLTGSAAEVVPVVKVDSRVIGTGKPGPITCDLKDRFHRHTRAS